MPLLYADLNSVRKTISGLAADFKSPRKLP